MNPESAATQIAEERERSRVGQPPIQVHNLQLTPKEELAVIVQRLALHQDQAENERCKVFLEVAGDLVRRAIHNR